MKRFYPQGRVVSGVFAAVCAAMTAAGVILMIVGVEDLLIGVFLLLFGITMGILPATLFIITSLQYLEIDDEKIIFPVTRSPRLSFRKNTVMFSDIRYVRMEIASYDIPLISALSHMYTFVLRDGTKLEENLTAGYGKKREREIVELLKGKVNFTA